MNTLEEYISAKLESPQSWMLLPPGDGTRAICRFPLPLPQPPEQCLCIGALSGVRLATHTELLAANFGLSFPWGSKADPEPHELSKLWKERRVGIGGLVHNRWFITKNNRRYGGAPNVSEGAIGRLRCYMWLDGGPASEPLADNEGYALVKDVEARNEHMYRLVHMHAAKHIRADQGAPILSPICGEKTVYIGFVGKCQQCPNPEIVTFPQIQASVPDYDFVLMDEWKNWVV